MTKQTYVKNEKGNFWLDHDLTDYYKPDDFELVTFPNLKPSTESISLRLPEELLAKIKGMANKRDVPYQSLIKMILADRVEEEQLRYAATKKRP